MIGARHKFIKLVTTAKNVLFLMYVIAGFNCIILTRFQMNLLYVN